MTDPESSVSHARSLDIETSKLPCEEEVSVWSLAINETFYLQIIVYVGTKPSGTAPVRICGCADVRSRQAPSVGYRSRIPYPIHPLWLACRGLLFLYTDNRYTIKHTGYPHVHPHVHPLVFVRYATNPFSLAMSNTVIPPRTLCSLATATYASALPTNHARSSSFSFLNIFAGFPP